LKGRLPRGKIKAYGIKEIGGSGMKRIFAAVLAIIFFVSGCSAATPDGMPNREPSQTQSINDTIPDNTGKETPALLGKPVSVNGDLSELQALEREFLESELCRQESLIPLTFTRDRRQCVAYRVLKTPADEENEPILVGMPLRQVDIYIVNIENGKLRKAGTINFVINHAWSSDEKLLALVSQKKVTILDLAEGKLREISLEYAKDHLYNANWSREGHILYIHLDSIANYYAYDVDSRKVLRVRGQFTEEDRVYRGNAGGYELWSKGHQVGVAAGLFSDQQGDKLLYSEEAIVQDIRGNHILVSSEAANPGPGVLYILEDIDLATGEKRQLTSERKYNSGWNLYKASYIKSTGDILYTIFDTVGYEIVYKLICVKPDGSQRELVVPSPLYTLTPGENLLDFATFDKETSYTVNPITLTVNGRETRSDTKTEGIRDIMLQALQIYSSEEPDEEEIRRIFINTYDPIPQEALENILLYKKQPGLWNFERVKLQKHPTLKIKLHENGNRATVAIDPLYFWGPHELVKQDGRWYITGFSTWYGNPERDKVKKVCEKYISSHEIVRQAKSVTVGEIEFWAFSDPHRVSPFGEYMAEARVKLVVTLQDGSVGKRQMYVSRKQDGKTWRVKNVGELRPGL
jgi:hypothetical protein